MTVIIAFKQNNKAAFVSDFRITFQTGNQLDAMCKYLSFDNRLGFFTAGSVEMWIKASDIVNNIISEVDIGNAAIEEGPLYTSLRRMVEETDSSTGNFGGIGFYLDSLTKQNVIFKLEGKAGKGLEISIIPNGVSVVGSGESIPDIANVLEKSITNEVKRKGFVSFYTANSLRNHLERYIVKCGGSVFEKLGISPVFNISSLESSGFIMHGEKVDGQQIANDSAPMPFSFSFGHEKGNLVLIDNNNNGKVYPVYNVITSPNFNTIGEPFDPKGLTKAFNPADFISGKSIYFLSQSVYRETPTSSIKTIRRILYKTTPFIYNQAYLSNPSRFIIAEDEKSLSKVEENKYINIENYGILISQNIQKEFEEEVHSYIMDDSWLDTYINNISGMIISNS